MTNTPSENSYPWYRHYDPAVPHHIDYPNISVHQLFDASADKAPSHPCLIFRDEKFTYGEVQAYSKTYARKLISLGVKPGDRIGVILPNSPMFVIVFFAILRAGAVVTAMNPFATNREIHYQLENADVAAVIGDFLKKTPILDAIEATKTRLLIFEDCSRSRTFFTEILTDTSTKVDSILQENDGVSIEFPVVSPDEPAIFQFSGGTTGLPKAAIGTHRGLVANTYQFSVWLTTLREGKETWLSAIPFYHVYGMVIGLCVGLHKRATLIILPDARDVQAVISAALFHRATFLPGVPALFSAIIRNLESTNRLNEKFSIKTCISGSASLHEKTKQRFEELTGSRILEGYGLSEAPTATHCNPLQGENRIGSIGLPLPDVVCKLVDIEGGLTEVQNGEPGELILQGPQVMAGYFNQNEAEDQVIKNNWLFTGDVARMDTDGFFYLVDRKKDLIKAGGFQVWPKEVESVLMLHPSIAEAAVIGVTGRSDNQEIVHAWLVLAPGMQATIVDLRNWCAVSLSRYKIPGEFHFIDELPKSSVGKVLRRKLHEMLE